MEAMIRRVIREEVLEALIHFTNIQAEKPKVAPAPKKEKPAPALVTAPVAPVVTETVTSVLGNKYEVIVPAPTPAPVVVEDGAITEEMLRKLCADTATKLGSADRVKKVLEGFGGKVYQVKDFAGAYEAIKMLTETANDNW